MSPQCNSELLGALQEKRLEFERNISTTQELRDARKGQLDDLVAGFSRTDSKLSDLRNSVRTVCNRWGSEQLSQQQQLWKLQQATVDLQRTVVSKACSNSPSYSKSSPLPFISNGAPTRSVFAEVQLNRQNTPVQEHDPKGARQMLHSQLRAMINTSTEMLHTLPRVGQADPECHTHPSPFEQQPQHYEQSGLYMMVDPETGKPVGGQLMQQGEIIPEMPQQQNTPPEHRCSTPHQESPLQDGVQCSDQHTPDSDDSAGAARRTEDASVSAEHSARDRSGQGGSARSGTNAHTQPIELLTPAIDQPHAEQSSHSGQENGTSRGVLPMPAFSVQHLAASSSADPSQTLASDASGPEQGQAMSDVDEHGLATRPSHSRNDHHSTCNEAEHEEQDTLGGATQGDVAAGMSEQSRTLAVPQRIDGGDVVSACEEIDEDRPPPGSRHIAQQGVVGAEMPRAQERQESQGGEVGHVHMQPSATSLSSLEETKASSAGHAPPAGPHPSPDAVGASSVPKVPTSFRSGSLQFGDGDPHPTTSGSRLSSQAVLELLKEESDLLEDDEEDPMSFMRPTVSFNKGTHRGQSSPSPDMSGFKTAAMHSSAAVADPAHSVSLKTLNSNRSKSVLDDSEFDF